MPQISKIISCSHKGAPAEKVIYVLQDTDGWFWIKKYVDFEGFATPFSSLEEIEVFLGMKFETTIMEDLSDIKLS